jgi:membrane protease YdiL (CAAX protease family)
MQPPVSAEPRRAFPGFWQALLLILLLLAGQGVVAGLLGTATGGRPLPVWLQAAVANMVAFAVVLWVSVRIAGIPASEVAPLRRVPGALLLAIVPLAAGLGILLSEVDNLFRSVVPAPRELLEQFIALGRESPIGGLIALVVVAPLTEELFFRGLVLRAFLRRYSVRVAIVLSALLFAIGHANPWQFASAGAGGLLLGWLYWRTGSLIPCFVAHAAFNGLSVVATHLLPPIPGFTGGDPFGPVEFQPLWLDGLGLLLVVVGWLSVARFAPPLPLSASADD